MNNYNETREVIIGFTHDKLSFFPIKHNLELSSRANSLYIKLEHLPESHQTKIHIHTNTIGLCEHLQSRIHALYLFFTRYVTHFVDAPDLSRLIQIKEIDLPNKTGIISVGFKVSIEAPVDRNILIEALWYTMVCSDDQLRLLQGLFQAVYAKPHVP